MTQAEPGTKTCPYCAEDIKAAAIKCRYCKSDLSAEAVLGVAPGTVSVKVPDKAPARKRAAAGARDATPPRLGPRVWHVYLLLEQQQTVASLVQATGIGAPAVKKHLKTLEGVGLLVVRGSGASAEYRRAADAPASYAQEAKRRIAADPYLGSAQTTQFPPPAPASGLRCSPEIQSWDGPDRLLGRTTNDDVRAGDFTHLLTLNDPGSGAVTGTGRVSLAGVRPGECRPWAMHVAWRGGGTPGGRVTFKIDTRSAPAHGPLPAPLEDTPIEQWRGRKRFTTQVVFVRCTHCGRTWPVDPVQANELAVQLGPGRGARRSNRFATWLNNDSPMQGTFLNQLILEHNRQVGEDELLSALLPFRCESCGTLEVALRLA